jgi:hypothetical protein
LFSCWHKGWDEEAGRPFSSTSTAVEVLAPEFVEKPAHQHVTNYTTAHIEGLVKKCNVSMVGLNLSQIPVNYCSDIDSDHVDYDLTGASTGDECELESGSKFGMSIAEKGRPSWKEAYSLTQDSQECVGIDFPPLEKKFNWKETNAFQAIGPFMNEYLNLLELEPDKESKIEYLVSVTLDLIIDLKKDQLKWLGINPNKGKRHVSCSHNKRCRVEIMTRGNNPYKKKKS